ncbi:MAG: helix-hairpin-helix domain-containing protein [Bacteroidaceae bacterium]|nr:helix-hairpin-helix domain-containing protein [Bacteroidaceae bacterium]
MLAQSSPPSGGDRGGLWDDFIEEYTSDVERAEEEDLQLHLQELKVLHEHPLNINTASVEDLLQLPFLSEAQIEQIHAYIYLHGQMQTLAELRLVPLLDEVTRRRISLFVYAEPEKKEEDKRLFSHLRNDFSTRLDIPLYYRMGQQKQSGGYRGDPLYHRMRYQIGNSKHFQAGLRVEKDAGERYYDSYGAYAMLHDVGILQRAIVGDYRIGFGEGLVVGGSVWNSKSTPPLKTQGGIRPMTGMDETNFLRGAAVTLSLGKHIRLSAFGSYRKRDATLTDKGEVQTLLTSGYHRTESEWERRRNVGSAVLGGNVEWYNKGFHLGATGYWQKFSRSLNPGSQQYRAIYPKGDAFGTAGVNYGYTRYRLSLGGETAYSTAGGWATINRASWSISRKYTVSAVQRFYAYQYYSFYSSALSENSNAQNESGVLLHLQAEPLAGLQMTAYADFFHHPWPRYRMTHSSTGQEFMLQGTYILSQQHTLLARYQLKRKENGDLMEPHHRVKLQWTCEPSEHWRLQTTGSFHNVLGSKGFMLTQNAHFMPAKPNMTFNAQLGWFHTDDYLSRIYIQQPSLYSSVSSASYYGHGMLGVLTARWQGKGGKLMLEARYGMVRYFDREEQGSGLQAILSPWKNDLSFQIRVKI